MFLPPPKRKSAILLAAFLLACETSDLSNPDQSVPPDDLGADVGSNEGPDLGTDFIDAGIDVGTEDPIAPCEVTLLEALEPARLQPPASGSNSFMQAAPKDRIAIQDAIARLASGNLSSAVQAANAGGYAICVEGEATVLSPSVAGGGQPVIAIRTGEAAPLIVEAPHAWFEFGTKDQAINIFETLAARALIVSGAHRCSADDAVTCDGITSTCSGVSAPYRISDVAHNDNTLFHAAHVTLSTLFQDAVALSLHGMRGEGLSLSDGTAQNADVDAPIARLEDALTTEFPGALITSCTPFEGANVMERLCGRTNVQGRALNGSANVCLEAAQTSSARFIHLEQSRAVRDQPAALTRALDTVF